MSKKTKHPVGLTRASLIADLKESGFKKLDAIRWVQIKDDQRITFDLGVTTYVKTVWGTDGHTERYSYRKPRQKNSAKT